MFRSLQRPLSLQFTIDGAGIFYQQSRIHTMQDLNTSIIQMNPRPAENPGASMEEIGDRTHLDRGDSDEEPDDDSDEDLRVPSLGSHVAEGSQGWEDRDGHAHITANDWAFLMYRTDLKGDPSKYQTR